MTDCRSRRSSLRRTNRQRYANRTWAPFFPIMGLPSMALSHTQQPVAPSSPGKHAASHAAEGGAHFGRLVGGEELAEDHAWVALREAADGHIGIDDCTAEEINRTITDGIAYGKQCPRRITRRWLCA